METVGVGEWPQRIRFERTVLDLARREVTHDGSAVHLEPQAFDLLALLIDERDRVVPKEELLERVWGDTFVSDAALTTRIKEARRAVGDDGRTQRIIRNVRGRGYRFVAEVVADGPDEPSSAAGRPLSRLLGRGAELDVARRALRESNLVTIVGPGGVGKTALAHELARHAGFADGVVDLRLATLQPADIIPALRRAAGVHSPEIDDHDAVSAIGALDALIVLDNCEHVVADVARLVEQFEGSRARLLATSRERLGHADEVVIRLEPLGADDARELFQRRAMGSAPASDPMLADDDTIDRITDAVDRLPLAIEMAAGLASTLHLGEVAALLETRVDVLRAPDRGAAERQQTLASLVDWSVAPLPTLPRSLLAGLTAFAGGVTATDVVGVLAGGDGAVIADLAMLVDRSLVVASTERAPTTYRLLATIRSNVGPPPGGALRRHAEWFAGVAAQADQDLGAGDDRGEERMHQRLDAVVAELRAAARHALRDEPSVAVRLTGALDRYAHTRLWAEPAQWAAELLDADSIDAAERAVAAAAAASHACHRGDYERASALATMVLESRPLLDGFEFDPVASALESLSDVHLYGGDLASAALHGRALVDRGHERHDRYTLVTGCIGQMLAAAYDGRPGDALAIAEGLDLEPLPPSGRAWLAYAEGEALAIDDLRAAIDRYEAALQLADSVSCHFVHDVAATSLLSARSRYGEPEAALPAFDTVLRDFRRAGCRTHATTAIRNLVDVFSRAGNDESAMILYGVVTPSPKQTFGAELQRLDEARSTAERRAGASAVERWIARGLVAAERDLGIDEALDRLAEALGT